MRDGETIRIYLWDIIAANFRTRWNASELKPNVLLLTTANAKFLGGAVTLSSTSASRVFFDADIAETSEFITWLSEQDPAFGSSSTAVAKVETLTINELNEFIEKEIPQILGESGWNYVSCTYCNTMLEESDTTLICTTCNKPNKVGMLRYRFEVLVSDANNDVATFVIFDREGLHFLGRRAAEVFSLEFPEGDDSDDSGKFSKKTPQCILDIVGRSCKFQVKLTEYNFRATRQTFTVNRIVEDNINIHSKPSEQDIEGDMGGKEPGQSTNASSGKSKKKAAHLQLEDNNNNKIQRHNT
ncbi:PREDICTED: uncharacterized protein LOC104772691 isoform X2 [Camelina sativa]|uniref:Uncharacterized protein LOC104772691 isoform X2 n=1 Tax=Camelina sativa TaxID=90675 RepID=A0ABM1RE87_CAMSA|nr:PREDICTED: uncharacterized protein LOC104772691 isoform X2 [Camelina sativa]